MKNTENKRKGKKVSKIFSIALLVLFIAFVIRMIINSACTGNLFRYINTFDPVDYSDVDRTLPEYNEDIGYYTFSAEGDLKVMVLTDLHICGGPYTQKTDKKTIYEVIGMLQHEKPDLVILTGDNTFCTPGIIFGGGGTFSNGMVSKAVCHIFEHEGVYFTTVFGNHDTESFDFRSRDGISKIYAKEKNKYCLYESCFSDPENTMPSYTNQIIGITNSDDKLVKLLLMIDSNSYIDGKLKSTINWRYDTIHDAQVKWAKEAIEDLSRASGLAAGEYLGTLSFMHIPTGEFQQAFLNLQANNFKDTEDTKYIMGIWDEEDTNDLGIRVWFGGCSAYVDNPEDADNFFEELGPDGLGALEAIFCGHDHVNNAVVEYKGVTLAYNKSLDNNAYKGIEYNGYNRGCTIITIREDGSYDYQQKSAYFDCNVNPYVFFDQITYEPFYPNWIDPKDYN